MNDDTSDDRLVPLAAPPLAADAEATGEHTPEDNAQTVVASAAPAAKSDEKQAMPHAEIEKIAIAARAAWHSAEEIHQIAREENRNFYANFKKIATHHAERLKQLEAHFEQNEQRMNELISEATRLMAEHQESVAQFNRTTRRLALSGFVMILILLVVMEIFWWVG